MSEVINRFTVKDYTFPTESRISHLGFDDKYMKIHLQDGRILMIPLAWVPTLQEATMVDRYTYFLGSDSTTIHWPPDTLNEDLRLADYLGPLPA